MSDELQYRMLDRGCVLRRCLHDGPIPLAETQPDCPEPVPAELQAQAPRGTVDGFLKALAEAYGAGGIAAVDGNMVVGKVRFFPSALSEAYQPTTTGAKVNTCVQEHDQLRAMARIGLDSLPKQDELSPKAISLLCFQLVNDYKGMCAGQPDDQASYLHRGIGMGLLVRTIEWARAAGWDELRATAVPHVPPLLTWSCHLSIERFRQFGFRITPSANKCDGALSQRRGYHGEAMKRMWEPYAHLSDEEVSRLYDATLRLD